MTKSNALYWRRVAVQALVDTIPDYQMATLGNYDYDHEAGSFDLYEDGQHFRFEVKVFDLGDDE